MSFAAGIALSLDSDTFVSCEVGVAAATGGLHLVVSLFSISWLACTDILLTVGEQLVLGLSEEHLVVLVLPLLAGVLTTDIGVLACEVRGTDRDEVHVPDSNEEVFEFNITFESLIHKLMVLHELSHRNGFVATELVVSIMERGEHLEEAEASLLGRLGSSDHIWVSRRVEVVLDFFDLKGAIAVSVELFKGFLNEASTDGIELTTEGSQKFVKADLAISTGVEDVKETLSVASAHAWHAIVVQDGLELTDAELA